MQEKKESIFGFRRLDFVKVGGSEHPFSIYEVLPKNSPQASLREKYEKALSLYENGDLKESLQLFQDCSFELPGDGACSYHAHKISHLIDTGGSPYWTDGSEVLKGTIHDETMLTETDRLPEERGNNHFALMKILFSVVFHLQNLVKTPASSGNLTLPHAVSMAEAPIHVDGT